MQQDLSSQTQNYNYIWAGGQRIPLPPGVSVTDWSLERFTWQNPRIRAFLGCIRLLGEVLESNYAILHCSPDRLLEIWRKVRRVSELIRRELAPLLKFPSCIPRLEAARSSTELALTLLEDTVLADLDRFPETIPAQELLEFRKLLCVSIGQIHAFLHDTFGELMAADPRSLHDADYFLSRRFPQDIEEAEWLFQTVVKLQDFLAELGRQREADLVVVLRAMRQSEMLPDRSEWQKARDFLGSMLNVLTPKLREVLALRGIRFSEMEILDRYSSEIPARCQVALELYEVAREVHDQLRQDPGAPRHEREQRVQDLLVCHASFSRRLVELLAELDRNLRDLDAFVPLWLEGIEKRRALMLRKGAEEADPEAVDL